MKDLQEKTLYEEYIERIDAGGEDAELALQEAKVDTNLSLTDFGLIMDYFKKNIKKKVSNIIWLN